MTTQKIIDMSVRINMRCTEPFQGSIKLKSLYTTWYPTLQGSNDQNIEDTVINEVMGAELEFQQRKNSNMHHY